MKTYNELNANQKNIANQIERIFIHNQTIKKADFLEALFFIGNKHKTRAKYR